MDCSPPWASSSHSGWEATLAACRLCAPRAAAAAVPLGLGAYLSFSRAALAAAATGVLVLIALAPDARLQIRAALVASGAAVLAALAASRLDTVKSLGVGRSGDTGEGLTMLAALILIALAAAWLTARPLQRMRPCRSRHPTGRQSCSA